MSRLCRLRLRRHGDDGQWAYDEIVKQRKQIEELQFALAETEALEMAHGERIEKLTAQVGVLREALSAAKYATRPSITLELIEQALATTPESALSEVRKHPIEFGMHGDKMMFKIGVQQFTLDYSPDVQDEFDCMKNSLIQAMSVFTPDINAVRKAERERCAIAITHAWHKEPCYLRDLTDAIRAMGDE